MYLLFDLISSMFNEKKCYEKNVIANIAMWETESDES